MATTPDETGIPAEKKAKLGISVDSVDEKNKIDEKKKKEDETQLTTPTSDPTTTLKTPPSIAPGNPDANDQDLEGGDKKQKPIWKMKSLFNPKMHEENDLASAFWKTLFAFISKTAANLVRVGFGVAAYAALLPVALAVSALAPISPKCREWSKNYWSSLGRHALETLNPENIVYGRDVIKIRDKKAEKEAREEEAPPDSLPKPEGSPDQAKQLKRTEKESAALREEPEVQRTLPLSDEGHAAMDRPGVVDPNAGPHEPAPPYTPTTPVVEDANDQEHDPDAPEEADNVDDRNHGLNRQ
jgi:hypothetical protein